MKYGEIFTAQQRSTRKRSPHTRTCALVLPPKHIDISARPIRERKTAAAPVPGRVSDAVEKGWAVSGCAPVCVRARLLLSLSLSTERERKQQGDGGALRRGGTYMTSGRRAERQLHAKVRCAPMQNKRAYRRHGITIHDAQRAVELCRQAEPDIPARLEVELLRPLRYCTGRCRVAHLAADQPLQRETTLRAITPHHGL